MLSSINGDKSSIVNLVAPSGGVTSGVPVRIGSLVCVPIASASQGELFAAYTRGEFELPKATGTTFTLGVAVEWNPATGLAIANGSVSGAYDVGLASRAAGAELVVRVLLNATAITANT